MSDFPDDEVARLRAETPGCADVVHLDNAGAALMPQAVLDAQIAHLRREARLGGYRAADEVREQAEDLYAAAAEVVGASPDEIAWMDSATRAWEMAFLGLRLGAGDRILCSRVEYASNAIAFLQLARRTGVEVVAVASDRDGAVDLDALRHAIDGRTRLIALTHVPTNGGLVNPAAEVGHVARRAGVPFLLDACQSVGQVDVRDVPWDLLSVTGRKYLRGPRGTGFLGVRRSMLEVLEPPILDLHGAEWVAPDRIEVRPDARRFETWERSWAGVLGLRAALRLLLDLGIERVEARIAHLGEALRERLAAVSGIHVHDLGRRRCGLVTFTVDGLSAEEVKRRLRAESVHVSASHASSTRWDMADRHLEALVRASVHVYNTEAELDRLVTLVDAMARAARGRAG